MNINELFSYSLCRGSTLIWAEFEVGRVVHKTFGYGRKKFKFNSFQTGKVWGCPCIKSVIVFKFYHREK